MKLSRRTLLKGTLGGAAATLALPLLEAMLDTHGQALANGDPLPRRFGVFFWGNGTRAGDWTPAQTGAAWAPTPNLQGLHDAGVVPDVAVVSGLEAMIPTGCHAPGRAMTLSGSHDGTTFEAPSGRSGALLPSCDQIAADHIGGETTFASVELAVSRAGVYGAADEFSASWRDENLLPAQTSPAALFERLFVGFEPDTTTRVTRLSILDAVLADAQRWHDKLGGPDRQRIAQHLDALRDLEVRIDAEPPACTVPDAPVDPPEGPTEALRERNDLFADVLAVALACDLTRVFSLRFTQSIGDTLFAEIGVNEGHHSLSHSNPVSHSATVAYTVSRFADLVRRFGEMPDGAGRLLDSCAIMATSDLTDGSTHAVNDMPMLVAGQAGGALKTGFHHGEAAATPSSIVPLTLLQAVGVPIDSFGENSGYVDAPLAALIP